MITREELLSMLSDSVNHRLYFEISSKSAKVLLDLLLAVPNQADLAAALAHRGCCGTEHDPANGKLHGYCVVCGVPWPCETAQYFLRKPQQ